MWETFLYWPLVTPPPSQTDKLGGERPVVGERPKSGSPPPAPPCQQRRSLIYMRDEGVLRLIVRLWFGPRHAVEEADGIDLGDAIVTVRLLIGTTLAAAPILR